MTRRILCAWLAGVGLIAPLPAQEDSSRQAGRPVLPRDFQNNPACQEMAKAIGAFKNAEYAKAVEHFRSSAELDAGCNNMRLYVATAYMHQCIPSAKSPEYLARAAYLGEQFERSLEREPDNEVATTLMEMASLCFTQERLDEAAKSFRRLSLVRAMSRSGKPGRNLG